MKTKISQLVDPTISSLISMMLIKGIDNKNINDCLLMSAFYAAATMLSVSIAIYSIKKYFKS